ncbi:hypothetical protein [Candidatus Albibeggiatoa sp. nov. NOAA]|uniref:hypothetical protein n=1 Tax=Candidatus Albibeggiatoa sp. nov. NOAA TaxID=3162724 RepID=UPI0032F8AE8A|nr:hypothetical protein [Thiotrichaceae bacterium]
MVHFLWVEDFEGDNFKNYTDSLFGHFVPQNYVPEGHGELKQFLQPYGIFLETHFLDALEFIRDSEKLFKIDFIILDIDLPIAQYEDENNYLPEILARYQNDEQALRKVAGYQLYIELVIELGFPKQRILFCSNHADYLNAILEAFENAKISLPNQPCVKNNEHRIATKADNVFLQEWIQQAQDNAYLSVRRNVIEQCQFLRKITRKGENLQFELFLDENRQLSISDMRIYLEVLESVLPLREHEIPSNKNKRQLYKIFLRTLAHQWDAVTHEKNVADPALLSYFTVMKTLRNWLSHIGDKLDKVDEKLLAFLFIVNMRAMYGEKVDIKLENQLLNLIGQPIDAIDPDHLQRQLYYSYQGVKGLLEKRVVEDKKTTYECFRHYNNKTVSYEFKQKILTRSGKIQHYKDIAALLANYNGQEYKDEYFNFSKALYFTYIHRGMCYLNAKSDNVLLSTWFKQELEKPEAEQDFYIKLARYIYPLCFNIKS